MFEREHHVRIATVLQALDSEMLVRCGCLFGGGTAIVLARGEYRESLDIDFIVSSQDGYRRLRELLKSANDLRPVTRAGAAINLAREVRADQYGLRTMVDAGGVPIKFEIIFEARVTLDPPSPSDRICGVSTLTLLDLATTKLLANSDRWVDDSVFSRDLIDLAMLDCPTPVRRRSLEKARGAYGESVDRDLQRAIERLQERAGRLDECMRALKIERVPKAVLWSRIRKWRARERT